MIDKKFTFIALILFCFTGFSQDVILENYIKAGLENNLALKQKELDYQKSLKALMEAKSLFFPEISFNARYSVAEGGRTIEFPVGDLMNPVYSTLNQLTQSQQFPQISNEEIYFMRPREHETKLSLRQAIFHPDIFFNYKISKDLAEVEHVDVNIYKRELVKEIKTAYYNYLKTVKALELFDEVMDVVKENLRVNESLYDNDKVTLDVVYRSKAEVSKVELSITEAEKRNQTAAAYFNFLLNRNLDESIEVSEEDFMSSAEYYSENDAVNRALNNREELFQLILFQDISDKSLKMNRYKMTPTISGAVDYGYQGEKYEFTNDADFVMASLVLRWKLFSGFETKAKVQQAAIQKDIINKQYEEARQQINLQVIESYYNVEASEKAVVSAKSQSESTYRAFKLINKKYNQGQSNLLEFIDARTSATQAELNHIIAKYDYQISIADFERVLGTYPVNN